MSGANTRNAKEALEQMVKQQNLIHELVIINQLLTAAADGLKTESSKVPVLEQEIKRLQNELKQHYSNNLNSQKLELTDKTIFYSKNPQEAIRSRQSSEIQESIRIENARLEGQEQKMGFKFPQWLHHKNTVFKETGSSVIEDQLSSLLTAKLEIA